MSFDLGNERVGMLSICRDRVGVLLDVDEGGGFGRIRLLGDRRVVLCFRHQYLHEAAHPVQRRGKKATRVPLAPEQGPGSDCHRMWQLSVAGGDAWEPRGRHWQCEKKNCQCGRMLDPRGSCSLQVASERYRRDRICQCRNNVEGPQVRARPKGRKLPCPSGAGPTGGHAVHGLRSARLSPGCASPVATTRGPSGAEDCAPWYQFQG